MITLTKSTPLKLTDGFKFVLFSLALSIATMTSAPLNDGIIMAPKLNSVIDLVMNLRAPTPDNILAAYKDYVDLHKLQSELADRQSDMSSIDSDALQRDYKQVNSILRLPMLHVINENLFNLIDDPNATGAVKMTESLRVKLTKAVENLGLRV